MSKAATRRAKKDLGTGPDAQRRALEEFSWYVEIARAMCAHHLDLVTAAHLPETYETALAETGGREQISASIERWEQLLEDYEGLPEDQRLEMKLMRNGKYRHQVAFAMLGFNTLRGMLLYQEDARSRLLAELRSKPALAQEDLSQWLSGEEAQASLQAAIKVAAHCQETGRYGTLAEAQEALTPEEFASYNQMIQRLCAEARKDKA